MFKSKSSRTRRTWTVTAVLIAPALLGITVPSVASAATPSGIATTASSSSAQPNAPRVLSAAGTPQGSVSATGLDANSAAGAESRGAISTLLKLFSTGVKKIPGLWSTFSNGVKKAYTWFANNTWKAVKAIAAAVSFLLNAYEVWRGFH